MNTTNSDPLDTLKTRIASIRVLLRLPWFRVTRKDYRLALQDLLEMAERNEKVARCAWCGKVDDRDKIVSHVVSCVARPEMKVLQKATEMMTQQRHMLDEALAWISLVRPENRPMPLLEWMKKELNEKSSSS